MGIHMRQNLVHPSDRVGRIGKCVRLPQSESAACPRGVCKLLNQPGPKCAYRTAAVSGTPGKASPVLPVYEQGSNELGRRLSWSQRRLRQKPPHLEQENEC